MSSAHPVVVLGATGFTGQLIVGALTERGIACTAQGRNPEKLSLLKNRFPQIKTLEHEDPFSHAWPEKSVVINTLGPFGEISKPRVTELWKQNLSYLDVTGELPFCEWSQAQVQELKCPARVVQSVAFESFIANMAVKQWVEEKGQKPAAIEIGYFVNPPQPSPGTRNTLSFQKGTLLSAKKNGSWHKLQAGDWCRAISVAHEPHFQAGVFLGYPEILFFGAEYDAADIATYHFMSKDQAFDFVSSLKSSQRASSTPLASTTRPERRAIQADPFQPQWSEQQAQVVVALSFDRGMSPQRCRVYSGKTPYLMTAEIAAEAAQYLAGSEPIPGYQTPAQAFPTYVFKNFLKKSELKMIEQDYRSSELNA